MAGMPLLLHWTDRNDKKSTINYDILVKTKKKNSEFQLSFVTQDRLIIDTAW